MQQPSPENTHTIVHFDTSFYVLCVFNWFNFFLFLRISCRYTIKYEHIYLPFPAFSSPCMYPTMSSSHLDACFGGGVQ